MDYPLIPHPSFPPRNPLGARVAAICPSPASLRLDFRVRGDFTDIVLPRRAAPSFRDELWRTTCFEAFIQAGDAEDPAYVEINLSASTEWAAYAFDDYRAGMRPLPQVPDPKVSTNEDGAILELTATVELAALPGLAAARPWRVGLSAILENEDGSKSYWALRHPPGKPDFHHRDCFALRIDAPADS